MEPSHEDNNRDGNNDNNNDDDEDINENDDNADDEDNNENNDNANDVNGGSESLTVSRRHKRQAGRGALGMAQSRQDYNGRKHRVGEVFKSFDVDAGGKSKKKYGARIGAGVGSVVYKSKNNRHSVGVGAYASQDRSRNQGNR
ncbi:hypothetical protein Avbf_11957 [Armadillidium vulgare]|nr:hypothetical protein Avbf_11957 [Armadillidium vulgare]